MNKLTQKHLKAKFFKLIRLVDKHGYTAKIAARFRKPVHQKPEELLDSAEVLTFNWPANVPKPIIGLVKDDVKFPFWPVFERFLLHNSIPYEFFDIHKSDFQTQAKKFDLILWHTSSSFADQLEAKAKIEFMEKHLGKMCFPSSEAIWFYEEKARQYWLFEENNIPAIPTFVSFSKSDVLDYLDKCQYPIVSKEATNSGSEGVLILENKKKAIRFSHDVFGPGHKVLSSTYIRQKDYVIFQNYVPNEGFDLRVAIVGGNYFGYYRDVPPGDFRASGSGLIVKKALPEEALYLAKEIKAKLPPTYYISIDFLKSKIDHKYYVIEISIFNRIRSTEQLIVDGVPGKYVFENGGFKFYPGRIWIHDLILIELLNDWVKKRQ